MNPDKKYHFREKNLLQKFHLTSISTMEKLFFIQNMYTMVKTGFPLASALQTLSTQTENKEFKKIISDLHQGIEKGQSLYAGLQKYPYVFSELFVNLIKSGEISGKLEESLYYLLLQIKKSYALKKKIRNALMYPAFITVAMIGLGIGMFVFVLPNMIKLYEDSNFILPLPTRIVISISKFILVYGWQFGLLLFIFITFFIVIIRSKKGKKIWHLLLLKIPIVSTILKKINLAQLSRVMNSLIATDIPITEIFRIIGQTLNNRTYRNYLLSVTDNLKKGNSIFSVFQARPDLFPIVMAQMINIGEQSGTLDNITKELAQFYEDEVSDTMANLTVIIEPIVMLFVGGGVAFIAVSVIYPIYALVNQI